MKILDVRFTVPDDVNREEFMWRLAGLLNLEEAWQLPIVRHMVKGVDRMALNPNPDFMALLVNHEQATLWSKEP